MTHTDRWELGSEFHWPLATEPTSTVAASDPWADRRLLLGCGRDALRLAIAHGVSAHGWRRLWLPSYLDQDVARTLARSGIQCTTYLDAPTLPGPDPSSLTPAADDVVLIVNYLGLREASVLDGVALNGAALIIDHTHDPWSDWAREGRSDYAVASLRKTLPLPDGAVLWSPNGCTLPTAPRLTTARSQATAAKWKAMRLKGHYLAGEVVAKADFRALAREGEARIASGEVSGMHPATAARLEGLPFAAWRRRRALNFKTLRAAMEGAAGLTILPPSGSACAFSAFVVFDDVARRERARAALLEARCYPGDLWPMDSPVLDGVPDAHRELAARSLSVPCDMRYEDADMKRVAEVVIQSVR